MRSVACLLLVLAASTAIAEDTPPPPPDYSRDGLRRALSIHVSELSPVPDKRHLHFGYFEFRALGMDWRLFYLPLAAPLAGSGPAGAGKLPTALQLISPRISSPGPPILDDERTFAEEREYRRIRKMTARTKLKE
jgi:hypothetical protein